MWMLKRNALYQPLNPGNPDEKRTHRFGKCTGQENAKRGSKA